MATTTVRLDDNEEAELDRLAAIYGGRSNALREGLRRLTSDALAHSHLAKLLAEWEAEDGPVSEQAIAAAIRQYDL